jgi:hypothetical protein
MNDFCDCSQCPHHCSGDDESIDSPTAATSVFDDSEETSNDKDTKASAEKKVKKLKKDIKALGFKLKDTDKGIRVTM